MPPSHTYHRPSGQTLGKTQDWTQMVRLASSSKSNSEDTKTWISQEWNRKLSQFQCYGRCTTSQLHLGTLLLQTCGNALVRVSSNKVSRRKQKNKGSQVEEHRLQEIVRDYYTFRTVRTSTVSRLQTCQQRRATVGHTFFDAIKNTLVMEAKQELCWQIDGLFRRCRDKSIWSLEDWEVLPHLNFLFLKDLVNGRRDSYVTASFQSYQWDMAFFQSYVIWLILVIVLAFSLAGTRTFSWHCCENLKNGQVSEKEANNIYLLTSEISLHKPGTDNSMF